MGAARHSCRRGGAGETEPAGPWDPGSLWLSSHALSPGYSLMAARGDEEEEGGFMHCGWSVPMCPGTCPPTLALALPGAGAEGRRGGSCGNPPELPPAPGCGGDSGAGARLGLP